MIVTFENTGQGQFQAPQNLVLLAASVFVVEDPVFDIIRTWRLTFDPEGDVGQTDFQLILVTNGNNRLSSGFFPNLHIPVLKGTILYWSGAGICTVQLILEPFSAENPQ